MYENCRRLWCDSGKANRVIQKGKRKPGEWTHSRKKVKYRGDKKSGHINKYLRRNRRKQGNALRYYREGELRVMSRAIRAKYKEIAGRKFADEMRHVAAIFQGDLKRQKEHFHTRSRDSLIISWFGRGSISPVLSLVIELCCEPKRATLGRDREHLHRRE